MADGMLKIGANSVLGFFTMVQATGEVVIGKETMIGPHCTLLASYHEMSSNPNIQKKLIRSHLYIKDNVWSGANVTFNCGITVWENSVIGANSFVNKDVPPNMIVAGSPAKIIKEKP
jgi:maltose O-acetyltransferase